jgi:hypothetical protein
MIWAICNWLLFTANVGFAIYFAVRGEAGDAGINAAVAACLLPFVLRDFMLRRRE